ncbi:MAG: hypothetical protein CM1200mP10_06940 [Candidatus Neomarinimicrobiota bacterium]|nr:MAG: hypothetical protein CM1200mP10_06940 [Candidatus Neomarinimicrobiota bacterium]
MEEKRKNQDRRGKNRRKKDKLVDSNNRMDRKAC